MKKLILAAFACALFATPTCAAVANDPKAIILDLYAHKKANFDYDPPKSIFTPRLAKLMADHQADADKAGDPAFDVDLWTNAQDFSVSSVTATAKVHDYHKDRQVVVTKVSAKDFSETVVFYFEKIGGKWLLDDMRWTGEDPWVLSLILRYNDWGDEKK